MANHYVVLEKDSTILICANRLCQCSCLKPPCLIIVGKDNYGASLTDGAMGTLAYKIEPDQDGNDVPLNAASYHRSSKVQDPDAMGLKTRHRGFSDENLFMALSTQERIVSSHHEQCDVVGGQDVCSTLEQRWSYAFPLEIVYTTPLGKWNPYNLKYRGDALSEAGQAVTADGRNGGLTAELAYNGTNSAVHYLTPQEFFNGDERDDPADTTQGVVGVLDSNGEVRSLRASGHRMFLPSIPGIGEIRQRYPVMPIHGEGQTVFKELQALKDIVLNPTKYGWAVNPQPQENEQ